MGYLAESSLGTWRIGNHEAAGGFLVDGFTPGSTAIRSGTVVIVVNRGLGRAVGDSPNSSLSGSTATLRH